MQFLMQLLDLACAEIERDLEEVTEVVIERGFADIWCVLFPQYQQEVFFSDKAPYHVNCYEAHPDFCLCDECAAFRFAVCGYED